MAQFEKLSIFFPMWNEEQYINRALNAGHDIARELMASGEVDDYELIVVNDASTDATARLADEALLQTAMCEWFIIRPIASWVGR